MEKMIGQNFYKTKCATGKTYEIKCTAAQIFLIKS